MKTKSHIKAGASINHNASGIRVKSAVKAGGLTTNNHNASGIRVKSAVKAGALTKNHNQTSLRAR